MKKNRAFTLLELLLVFAVMLIIVSMILPAFRQLREKGRRSKCVFNLNQLHKGIMLYAADFGGALPAGVWWNGTDASGNGLGGGVWDWTISPYMYNNVTTDALINSSLDFLCPTYVVDHQDIPDIERTYAMSTQLNNQGGFDISLYAAGTQMPWPHLDKIADKSNTILLAPVMRVAGTPFPEENAVLLADRSNVDSLRHGVGANYLFVDGSIRFLTASVASDNDLWTAT